MSIKFPAKIKIMGLDYEILYPYHFKEKVDICAQADHCLNEIRVNNLDQGGSRRTDDNIMVSFWHEFIHTVGQVIAENSLKGSDSEPFVELLAHVLQQIFRDNDMSFLQTGLEQKE